MLILGIDPGSTATGYGLVESLHGRVRAIGFGAIAPPRGLAFLDRLPRIASALEALLDRVHPDEAAVEDLFFGRNGRVALRLGHVRGVALLPLLRSGIPVHEYAPRLVKKAVTGYGAAEKDQVRLMVRSLLGLHERPLSVDASDALAVAICHAHAALSRRWRAALGA